MIVVDASVTANAVADDTDTGQRVRARLASEQRGIAAPDLFDVETMSVLRRRWLSGALTLHRFSLAVDDLVALPITRVPTRNLLSRAFALRSNLTPYDAVYVALAEALDAPLLTADARLSRSPGITCRVEVLR